MMAFVDNISITEHTTSSNPHPHVLYCVKVQAKGGKQYQVFKRFSEFYKLHEALGDPYTLPPKDVLTTTLQPGAWLSDERLSERKLGLEAYLNSIVGDEIVSGNPLLVEFLRDVNEDVVQEMCSTGPSLAQAAQGATGGKQVAAAYYATWSADSHPPNKIDFSKFDILFYAFVTPNSSSTISWDSGSQETLRTLVSSARQSGQGTKIVLSIGGWGGSYWFSQSMSNVDNRRRLSGSLIDAVNKFGLDGVDIDWEYPNSPGSGNPFSRNDAANFLAFLKVLRAGLGWNRIISAAVAHQPWVGPDGRALKNVTEYAAQMTYVNIMNYDVCGGAAPPGPNAPLGNNCNSDRLASSNAQAAVAAWTAAGFPSSKLLLGLPLYGYVIRSSSNKMFTSDGCIDAMALEKVGIHARPRESVDQGLAAAGDVSRMWGQQVAFSDLLANKIIRKQDGKYVADSGYQRGWDNCSSTPFLFNPGRSTFISYDDNDSLYAKAQFAKQKGLGGCFTWSLDQDDGLSLQYAIRAGLFK